MDANNYFKWFWYSRYILKGIQGMVLKRASAYVLIFIVAVIQVVSSQGPLTEQNNKSTFKYV